jgi:hypothetical protein
MLAFTFPGFRYDVSKLDIASIAVAWEAGSGGELRYEDDSCDTYGEAI